MTQPPQGPWRPMGPLPPPQARPMPPNPVPGHGYPRPYGMPPGPPPQMPPGPGYPPPRPGYPPAPPPSNVPPWVQYPGYPHRLAPRRKSNTGALVATIIVVVLFGAVAMIGLVSMSDRGSSVADTGYDSGTTETTTYSSETTTTTTTDETTTTTTTEETAETTEDTPTETTPAGPQPVYALEDNPLFYGDVGLPAVTCNLAQWQTNPAGAAAFFQSALPCMDAAWQPVLEHQGLPFFTPNMVFPEGTEWSTPCGDVSAGNGAVAAFYCSGDNTIYMPFAALQTDLYGAKPGVYLALLAHEYGHHVQTLAGVMDAYWDLRYNTGADTEPGLELSRRFELQAQCFSGMFLASTYGRGSVNDAVLTEARTSQDRGDHVQGRPRDHGTDEHAIAWWEQGAQLNRTFQCNTWLSPPADVA